MTTVREGLPPGRYGRRGDGSSDARTDRRLTVLGCVLGVVGLVVIGWFGYSYVAGQDVSAELVKFDVVSEREVQVHLEVRKDADTVGVCTVRSRSEDGAEVGRADFTFDQRSSRVDKVVTLRTIDRATTAELVGCQPSDQD